MKVTKTPYAGPCGLQIAPSCACCYLTAALRCERRARERAKRTKPSSAGKARPEKTATPVQKARESTALSRAPGGGEGGGGAAGARPGRAGAASRRAGERPALARAPGGGEVWARPMERSREAETAPERSQPAE